MTKIYEAWSDVSGESEDISFFDAETIASQGLPEKATLLYRVEADTYEDAMRLHHERMGWEPYKPMGSPAECPRGCGSTFYPEGSGECRVCGRVC